MPYQHKAFCHHSYIGDNLLYADKAYDITREVITGLNKAYKGKLKGAEETPAKKK